MGRTIGNYSGYGIRQVVMSAALLLLIFLVFAAVMLIERYRTRKRLLEKIRREWGQEPERDYDPAEFDCISHFYRNCQGRRGAEEFVIDDITWNDLDLDRIFKKLNHTRSFLGESYLYRMLRTPCFSKERLEEFEYLVNYCQEHAAQREEMEYFFAKIGKTGRRSVFDYIYNLAEAEHKKNPIHFAAAAFFFLSAAVLLTDPRPGILLLVASAVFGILTYEKYKRPIRPYIVSCVALERVLRAAGDMLKLKTPVLDGCRQEILAAARALGKLRWPMFLLTAGEQQSGLEQIPFVYLNNCLHLDLILFPYVVRRLAVLLPQFELIVEQTGRIEAAIAVASFRTMSKVWAVPVFHEGGGPFFCAKEMVHPLIREPVPNTVETRKSILVTGSNASGKSTFLKTAALTALFAQTIHTVTAGSYEASFFRIYSSMALRDDLMGEESYFIVEIRSLKRILDQMQGEVPLLCCIDEVLRGTNTVERIAASSQILKSMAAENLLCFAATHDIELTYLLEDCFENCHFEEEVAQNEILFDYQLRRGRASTRNAIRLLHLMGYADSIIEEAERLASELAGRKYGSY